MGWDTVGDIAVSNVVVKNVDTNNTQNGFFGAPLMPEHLGVGVQGGFDANLHRPSNITISNFQVKMSHADGINFHGNFDNVIIDKYIVDSAFDDCIALWSYRDLLGKVTITNSEAHSCGYQGCYVVYGGAGPYTYANNECSGKGPTWKGQPPVSKCLWLDGGSTKEGHFNAQFNDNITVSGRGFQCKGRSANQACVQRGAPRNLCPAPPAPQVVLV